MAVSGGKKRQKIRKFFETEENNKSGHCLVFSMPNDPLHTEE